MGGGSDLEKLSAEQNCLLGMITGMMTKAINYPFLSWKIAVQQGLPISFNPAVVYRGLPMAMLNLGGTSAVQFGTTGFFTRMLASSIGSGDTATVGGAFLGGFVSGFPCSIWELIIIQQQRFGSSILATPANVVREYGALKFVRGVPMCIGRESLFTMAMLGITPVVQTKLVESSGMERNTALAAGSLGSACLAGAITHPMDTVKTCMQGDLAQAKYTGIIGTASKVHAEYGVQGFFKGLSYRIGLIATTFFLINKFKQQVGPMIFPGALGPSTEAKASEKTARQFQRTVSVSERVDFEVKLGEGKK